MRNIWLLVRGDLRRATSNVMAGIVLFGLIVIPSLFTWFNVISSWDPFDNTQNLKVAVANADEGYQSDLIPLRINVGDQVLSTLRANHDLDWEITSVDDAIDGTKSEEYYAAIVLPPTFSKEMMTFYSGDSAPIGIDYYDNEKKNALSPKITDQGASQVAAQVNETFAATLGEAGLNIVSSLSKYLESADTQVVLSRLQSHAEASATQLRSGADTATMFTSLISSSKPLVSSASDSAIATGRALGDTRNAIGGGVEAATSLKATLDSAAGTLGAALSASAESYPVLSARSDEAFAALDAHPEGTADALHELANSVQAQANQYGDLRDGLVATVRPALPEAARGTFDGVVARIDRAIAQQHALHGALESAAEQVRKGNADLQTTQREVRELIAEARESVRSAESAYSSNLKPKLDQLSTTLDSIDDGISSIGTDLSGAESTLSGDTDSVLGALTRAESTTTSVANSLTDAARDFDDLASALSTAIDSGDLSDLTDMIGTDPHALASALSAPVELDRVPVFPVASFGTGMAPFYTVLGLWVGALLIAVSIRDDVHDDALPGSRPLTVTQAYLGRFGIVALIGFLQSSLVTIGNLVFVQVDAAHPLLLILAGWMTSFVFTLIIYTFVAAFGNAGKALAVVLLVFQISASGGAYPLELLPQWFQAISPWLPATHAIDGMRSALAGTYHGDYWIAMGTLALFLVPTLLLGLLLRRPMIGYNRDLKEALESTKLM